MGSSSRGARRRSGTPGSSFVSHSIPADDDAAAGLLADVRFDPAAAAASASAQPRPDPRAEQLAAQVADALSLALAGARDPWLADLVVASVVPRRGAARLEVTLEVDGVRPVGEVARRVQRAVGWLRGEVADAIERKRVPELVLVVVPAVSR